MLTVDKPFVVYDIGARGRLQDFWHEIALRQDDRYRFVLFEPDPQGAADLRKVYESNMHVTVVEQAALHRKGQFPLHVTRHSTCSSILRPNGGELARYNLAPIFKVIGQINVSCDRLDNIASSLCLPPPDFIKIDVQGAEYLVLEGMGALLSTCLGVELETHLYPIYNGQRVLGEIISLLSDFDLRLCELTPQRHFDYEYVEANATFCATDEVGQAAERGEKIRIIREACSLWFYPQGQSIRASL